MGKTIGITDFRLYRTGHRALTESGFSPKTEIELISAGLRSIPAVVPDCVERDLAAAGEFPSNLAYGDNILKCRELERTHFFYAATFIAEPTDDDTVLCFEGIDTVSEIFVDGKLLGKTENMLIPHEFPLVGLNEGEHELLVHIIPVSVYVADKEIPASRWALRYNLDSVRVRKAPYMFGWDILPRAVSAGLWRPVTLRCRPKTRLSDVFFRVNELNPHYADVSVRVKLHTDEDDLSRFTIGVSGECEDSVFDVKYSVFGVHNDIRFGVENPKIWQVRGRGKQYLYNVAVTLYDGEIAVYTETLRTGLRTVYLDRGKEENGKKKFDLVVNGERVFVLGTNLVPTDIFPAVGDTLTERELALVTEIGCNAVRIWGGGVYRSDEFYDRCDELGLLVWQDFMMACAIYPQDAEFAALIKKEAESVVKRLRNHPSVALWAGDNECDDFWLMFGNNGRLSGKRGAALDPNDNVLTRAVIPTAVSDHDGTRPYLPSSPYRDEDSVKRGEPSPEEHLWGPRDRFKGDYYAKNDCRFASETGYHGFPSPASLRRFIRPEHIDGRGDGSVCSDPDWLVHATDPEPSPSSPYAYRIPLITRQVEYLFGGKASALSLEDYALASQISQAEAMKFFIERFRADKQNRSGIIWWNMIDGFPEISDAVVDYYGRKKLAFSYIRRSQSPVCMLFDEPDENGELTLKAVNDEPREVTLRYTVSDGMSGKILLSGNVTLPADGAAVVATLPEHAARFLLIRWNGDEAGENHYVTRIDDTIPLDEYLEFMRKTGFNRSLEGFRTRKNTEKSTKNL